MRNLCSLSVQTQISSFIFFLLNWSTHWHCFEHLLYMYCFFIIAEMALTMPCSFYMLQKYSSNVFKTCFYFSFPIFYMDVYQQLFLNISGWSYFLNSKFAICTYFAWLNSCMFTDLIWHTQNVTLALIFFSLGMCIVFSCHKFWCFRFFYEHAFFKMNLKSNLLINFE